MARIAGANPPQPYLSVWNPGQKAIRRNQFISINLVRSGLDIDGNEFALVSLLHNGAQLALIDCIPAAGKFLFAVTWLGVHTTHLSDE